MICMQKNQVSGLKVSFNEMLIGCVQSTNYRPRVLLVRQGENKTVRDQ